jgi:uroporphyrinogen-III synthase
VQSAEGLLAEFPSGPGTVLVVQAVDAAPDLVDGLTARGFTVTATMPYRSVPANPAPSARAAALEANAVLFASGSAARGWVQVFGTATPPVVIAIGDKTASAAADTGISVTAVASDHSLAGLVATLGDTLPYDS